MRFIRFRGRRRTFGNIDRDATRITARPVANFTLIELLVVIAIIGILTSLLFPSLSKARVKAYAAISISNMKQIGNAFMVYASDEDGNLPPSRYPTGTSAAWPDYVQSIMNLESSKQIMVHPGVGFSSNIKRTYSITQAVMGITQNGWSNDRIPRKVNSIKNPSQTHILTEGKLQSPTAAKWRITWGQLLNDLNAASTSETIYLDFPYNESHHLLNGDISVITRKFSQRLQITEPKWKGHGY